MTKIYIYAAVSFAVVAVWAAWTQLAPSTPPQITPLKAPLMKQLPEFDAAYKDAMLWGTYRAGHYFGMRTR
jgi:mannosyl-oligosaccharide glucosidase